ncbi:MAG: DMT family transporter, partial [Bacteroidia bacterium]|nr:DMT family transporter [Bacteroidia bacterium]
MSKPLFSWLILIALALVWGSSFMLMKQGMKVFSAEEVAGLRIVMASVFLLPFLIKHGKVKIKKYWPAILVMGMFGNLFPAFLFTAAENGISSSLTGMLNALTPLFTILIAVLIFKSKTNLLQFIGILIGFGGAVLLMYFNEDKTHHENGLRFCLMVAAATLCYAISVNVIRRYLSDLSSVTATVWSFTFIGPMALAYLFLRTDFIQTIQLNANALPALGYISILGVVGSSLSVIAFNYLIIKSGAVFASSVTYLIP